MIPAAVTPLTVGIVHATPPKTSLRQLLAEKQLDQIVLLIDRERKQGRGRKACLTLVDGLKDRDPAVRWVAACMLTRLGADAQDAIPSLAITIHDADAMVRWSAADALREILPHSPDGLDILITALADKDELVRWSAVQTVAKIGPRALQAAPILVEMLGDESLVVRREAARTLRNVFPHITAVSSTRP
jgi:HEAT repeat protein